MLLSYIQVIGGSNPPRPTIIILALRLNVKIKINHPTHGRILTLKGSRVNILRSAANYLATHYPKATANVISVSGGLSSAVAGKRVVVKSGPDSCLQWFADTRFEDDDSYRFLNQTRDRLGTLVIIYTDGRTPVDVWEGKNLIPNNFKAPCTKELKIAPFKIFIRALSKALARRGTPIINIHLGMDWREMNRMAAPKANYESIRGVKVVYPLLWLPYELTSYYEVVKGWGVEPPRLYDMGFGHNNCGGRCCRQGAKEFKRLYDYFPDRFYYMARWERKYSTGGGPRRGKSFLTRVHKGVKTMLFLEALITLPLEAVNPHDDRDNCHCTY